LVWDEVHPLLAGVDKVHRPAIVFWALPATVVVQYGFDDAKATVVGIQVINTAEGGWVFRGGAR
jgi:hypothetical protein